MHCLRPNLFLPINSETISLTGPRQLPILKNIFSTLGNDSILILTEKLLLLQPTSAITPTHFLTLNFQTKFETLYQSIPNEQSIGIPIGLKIENEESSQELIFTAKHPSIAEQWSLQLEKRINQRNFHGLFKAKRKIGKGAFATVYLAERLRDHKMVAVKAFSKQKQYSSDKGRQSLQNQIKLMRQLNHPNISKLEGVYQTSNSIYVILQYLQGRQLNEVLKNNNKISSEETKEIIFNILKGLVHLSQHKIIHRDLKPQNIIFRKENSNDLAICDFGLATHADQQQYLFVRCGTPGFVAPEIINIKDMSAKSQPISDIFSVGIIFHYLLFGSSIFAGKKYNQILQQNRSCLFSFDKDIYRNLNHKAFDLLTKMLEKDPLHRISANNALNHSYFDSNMDIQYHHKSSNIPHQYLLSSSQTQALTYETCHKRSPMHNYFNVAPKENNLFSFV